MWLLIGITQRALTDVAATPKGVKAGAPPLKKSNAPQLAAPGEDRDEGEDEPEK